MQKYTSRSLIAIIREIANQRQQTPQSLIAEVNSWITLGCNIAVYSSIVNDADQLIVSFGPPGALYETLPANVFGQWEHPPDVLSKPDVTYMMIGVYYGDTVANLPQKVTSDGR